MTTILTQNLKQTQRDRLNTTFHSIKTKIVNHSTLASALTHHSPLDGTRDH
jgi:hypothetical protein